MRVTLIGHASLLIELHGATCLMDPVLDDPFEEGTVVSCPQRRVELDALPEIDTIVISHRHPDHFDLPSLHRLARDVDVICPGDPLIVYVLRELGFAHVHAVEPMAPILGADFELFPTRSELTSIPEMGMVFRDHSGTFWNQVDTPLADQTIDAVRKRFRAVDVLFAMYASQNLEFFESRAADFPADTHRRNLETALRIAPTTVVPASAGFRFCDVHEWLNAFLFPISRERFVADLRRLEPVVDFRIVDPGDVLELDGSGAVNLHRGAATFVRRMADDTARLAFDPTAPVPPLTDSNPDGYETGRIEEMTEALVGEVRAWLQGLASRDDRVVRAYRQHGVRYRIGLVFPGGGERRVEFDFTADPPVFREAAETGAEADLVHRIAASALAGWMEHRRSFFSVRAHSRRSGSVYALRKDGTHVTLEPRQLPDLLMYYLVYIAAGSATSARTEVDRQLAELRAADRK